MAKCVLVTGPECSGSKLIAKTIAHAMGIINFNTWSGIGWSNSRNKLGNIEHSDARDALRNNIDVVCHRSIPYAQGEYLDIDDFVKVIEGFDRYFVLTTRDQSVVNISKHRKTKKNKKRLSIEKNRSRKTLIKIINEQRFYIWSYETFMYVGKPYLKNLYNFLGVDSNFCPNTVDGNSKYIIQI